MYRRTDAENLVDSLAGIIRQVNREEELVSRSELEEQITDHVDRLIEDRLADLINNRVKIEISLD